VILILRGKVDCMSKMHSGTARISERTILPRDNKVIQIYEKYFFLTSVASTYDSIDKCKHIHFLKVAAYQVCLD